MALMRLWSVSVFAALIWTTLSLAVDPVPAPGKQIALKLDVPKVGGASGETEEMHYWLFAPDTHAMTGNWPLIVFLHGAGERGNANGSELAKVKVHGPPKLVEGKPDFKFVVVSPQCPTDRRWDNKQIIELINKTKANANLKIDPKQIHLTGLSMGGFGSWSVAADPSVPPLATLVPICGGGETSTAATIKDIPTWVFHGDKDQAVPYKRSVDMVEAIRTAGGMPKFTTYYGVGHDSWTATYANSDLYAWMLEHKRQ